jgi:hypothetical protein
MRISTAAGQIAALFVFAGVALLASTRAADEHLPVGTKIQFDKVYASDPALSQWIEGEITGYMPAQKYYKIRATNGINYTIANDPRWIKKITPSDKPAEPAKPQDAEAASGDRPKESVAAPPQQAPAGKFAVGTRIQFDRVEASNPANGRWDSGVIESRAANNRLKIRGDNGTLYTIQDDPRWILPKDAALPGPRHDDLDAPAKKDAPPDNGSAPLGGVIGGVAPDAQAAGTKDAPAAGAQDGMPPDGLYNVTNLGSLHSVGELEIKGATYRGLEASGPFKALKGTPKELDFSEGLAGLDRKIKGANYAGLNKLGQPMIKIRYTGSTGFNEELEAVKEH